MGFSLLYLLFIHVSLSVWFNILPRVAHVLSWNSLLYFPSTLMFLLGSTIDSTIDFCCLLYPLGTLVTHCIILIVNWMVYILLDIL